MSRIALPVLALLSVAFLAAGCSSQSPAEAGEEYGSTIVHGDPLVECIVKSVHAYKSEEDQDAFLQACKERAER
ncbi:hypothetical protein [Streptomyces sp. NPDC056304]|uniref:hypothetical protein n=1 Tax=Streptomyces sp. NPDC056304 TaxID=3345778 RepID=UPI0035DF0A69